MQEAFPCTKEIEDFARDIKILIEHQIEQTKVGTDLEKKQAQDIVPECLLKLDAENPQISVNYLPPETQDIVLCSEKASKTGT